MCLFLSLFLSLFLCLSFSISLYRFFSLFMFLSLHESLRPAPCFTMANPAWCTLEVALRTGCWEKWASWCTFQMDAPHVRVHVILTPTQSEPEFSKPSTLPAKFLWLTSITTSTTRPFSTTIRQDEYVISITLNPNRTNRDERIFSFLSVQLHDNFTQRQSRARVPHDKLMQALL